MKVFDTNDIVIGCGLTWALVGLLFSATAEKVYFTRYECPSQLFKIYGDTGQNMTTLRASSSSVFSCNSDQAVSVSTGSANQAEVSVPQLLQLCCL